MDLMRSISNNQMIQLSPVSYTHLTACNVSGDNAIGVIVETIYRRFICKSSAQ